MARILVAIYECDEGVDQRYGIVSGRNTGSIYEQEYESVIAKKKPGVIPVFPIKSQPIMNAK